MNNSLNEYLRFNFELNIELNHFLARFNVKMNNQNVSPTPSEWSWEVSVRLKGGSRQVTRRLQNAHCQRYSRAEALPVIFWLRYLSKI